MTLKLSGGISKELKGQWYGTVTLAGHIQLNMTLKLGSAVVSKDLKIQGKPHTH
jgi:hypothetical protein